MASPIKQTLETRNEKRTSVSISGPAYKVAVGGSPRGSKPKTKKYVITVSKTTIGDECRITSRYLRPPIASCHDLCKRGTKDESLELKKHIKMIKTKRDTKSCAHDGVVEVIKGKNLLPLKKVTVSKQSLSANRKFTQNEPKLTKNHVNGSASVKRATPKSNHTGSLHRNRKIVSPVKDQNMMTKNKLKQLIAEKVTEMTEMTMHEATTAELEIVPLAVEIMESPPTVITESTDLVNAESVQSSLDEQVLEEEEECEDINNEEVILSEVDYEMVISDEENEGLEVQFRRGKVVEIQCEDDGPMKLKFREGTVLEDAADDQSVEKISFKEIVEEARDDCEEESETVNLKHQEMEEKEAQELLNRVIEETASKLVVDRRKTKVGALVGAFEAVISSQDKWHTNRSNTIHAN